MTPQAFDEGMEQLLVVWPNESWNDGRTLVYAEALREIDDEVWMQVVRKVIATSRFFPKPAELREQAMAILGAAGVLPAGADTAWDEVLSLARHWYPGKPITVGVDLVDAALRPIGGLRGIAMASNRELGFLKRDFLRAYSIKREVLIDFGGHLSHSLPEGAAGGGEDVRALELPVGGASTPR